MAFDKEQLLTALWSGVSQVPAGTFACCGEIDGTAHCLPASLSVEGLGKLPLPLSYEHGFRLREMAETQPATYSCRKTSVLVNHDRRAWELGAAKLSCPDNEEFFSQGVPEIASEFVGRLGEDAAAIGLKTKLLQFQFSERGGCIQFNRKFLEPGMFGLLILQLPTASGHTGGAVVVSQDGTTQSLDCSVKSSSSWYAMAFFHGCEYKMKQLETGMQLSMVFALVRENTNRTSVLQVRGFADALAQTEAALKPWVEALKVDSIEAIVAPHVLAVPLGHKYKGKTLSFASLEGNDRVAVELLRQCGGRGSSYTDFALNVQLCRLMKVQVLSSKGHQYERFECRNWVEADGGPKKFFRIQIDMKSELVMSEGLGGVTTRDEHHEDEVQEDEKHDEDDRDNDSDDGSEEDDSSSNGQEVSAEPEELSATDHLALVVVFPKFHGTYVACRAGFSGALDMVEGKHNEGAPETVKDLRQLLDFYLKQPQHLKKVWKAVTVDARDGKNHSARLVKMCLLTGEYDHVRRLISMLGQDFEANPGQSKMWYLGMGGVEVAKALALVVESHGQEAAMAIQEALLLESRAYREAEYFAAYVIELHSRGWHEAAIAAGKKTYALVSNCIDFLGVPAMAAIAQMLIICVQEDIPSFVTVVQRVEIRTFFGLVLKLKSAVIAKSVSLEGNTLFADRCRELATRDLASSQGKKVQADDHHPSVGRVMEVLLWLQNGPVLQAGVQTLLSRSRRKNQAALKELLASEVFWQQAAVTSMGRKALLSLAQERIGYLSHEPQPEFTYTPKPAPAPPAHSGQRRGGFRSRQSPSEAQARAATFARVGFDRRSDIWAEGQKELENLRKRIQVIRRDQEEHEVLAGPKRMKVAHALGAGSSVIDVPGKLSGGNS